MWLRQHARGRLPSATSQVAFDTCYDAVLMVTARRDHGASGMGVRARVVPAPSVAQFYGRAVAWGVSSKTITVNVIGGPMSGLGVPREEARLAVVLNGGVSLAVWMGGPITELDRLMRRIGSGGAPLRRLVCTARTDVKVGTSAGGINGAALALSQVNEYANLSSLRDMWADQRQAAAVPALVGIEVGGRRLRRAGERVARGAHDRTYELNRSDGS